MIDIVLYRQRIGGFGQKTKNKKFLKYNYFEAYKSEKYSDARKYIFSKSFWVRTLF